MDKIDIVLWVLSGGFGLMLVMWHFLTNRIDIQDNKISIRMDVQDNKISARMDAQDNKMSARMDVQDNKISARMDVQDKKMSTRMDVQDNKMSARMDIQDNKMSTIEKDLQQINTKIAVIESKLMDISNNISHLMWHQQVIPTKDESKEN